MKTYLFFILLLSFSTTFAQTPKERVKSFFDKLDRNNMQLVDEFYHEQVEFIDPVGPIKGSAKIKEYYEGMYKNVEELKFEFSNFIEADNQVVAVWKMTLKTDKLNGGKSYSVDGNSVVRFDESGKAIYHRDYFDLGDFVYERVPVLGYFIRKVKENLKTEK